MHTGFIKRDTRVVILSENYHFQISEIKKYIHTSTYECMTILYNSTIYFGSSRNRTKFQISKKRAFKTLYKFIFIHLIKISTDIFNKFHAIFVQSSSTISLFPDSKYRFFSY